jgi:putative addiction module killer protein
MQQPFQEWIDGLKDREGRAKITARIDRLSLGNFGDCKGLGGGLHELRIDFGPGYRVYFADVDKVIVLLSCAVATRAHKLRISLSRKSI